MKRAFSAACFVAIAFAQAPPSSGPAAPDVGTNVTQAVVDYYDSTADYFKLRSRAVQAIAQKGIADHEIPAVLLLARDSNLSPNQVIDARKAGRTYEQIAAEKNVKLPGSDFVAEANVRFLSEYHGRTAEEIRDLHKKGSTFIDINQQFRRVGTKPKSEQPAPGR